MDDQHMSNVAAFIVFFVCVALFMVFCNQIDALIKSRRALKYAGQIKVGGVITKKIPKEELPKKPKWANVIMENRVTGKLLPASMDSSGVWHMPEHSDPVKLSIREWTIKNEDN